MVDQISEQVYRRAIDIRNNLANLSESEKSFSDTARKFEHTLQCFKNHGHELGEVFEASATVSDDISTSDVDDSDDQPILFIE